MNAYKRLYPLTTLKNKTYSKNASKQTQINASKTFGWIELPFLSSNIAFALATWLGRWTVLDIWT